MVKVLENQIVDLDVLPGTQEEQLKAQADKLSSVARFPRYLYGPTPLLPVIYCI